MKFGDKLVELRKRKGYSQEELAEKLGVSRQSVSKWESNNTYPETDKIIQIANLFDCSMDDLINDKVTDVESSLRENKNVYRIWDSLLEFLTKTINMFSNMTFGQGLKCVLEMIGLSLVLAILTNIFSGITSTIISNIFSFLNPNHVLTFKNVLDSVFSFILFIVSIIIIIYTFKIRYLNDYEKETVKINQKKSDNLSSNNKDEKKIIRNENEKPFEFLGALSKIVITVVKVIIFFILLGFIFGTVGLIVMDVVMISFIPTHILFLWLALLFIACIIVFIQIIILLIDFIFNKKYPIKANVFVFIGAVILFGASVGMTVLTIKNIDFISDNSVFNIETKEINLEYKDDLVIENSNNGKYSYVIDNSMVDNQITVSRDIDSKYFKLETLDSTNDSMPVIRVVEKNNDNLSVFYDLFISNLKKNKVYTFENYGNDPLVIKANENTIHRLIDNLKKLYLVDEEVSDNGVMITVYQSKVYFKKGLLGTYDARNDSIQYDEDNYGCKKEIESTIHGERIIYVCDYTEED